MSEKRRDNRNRVLRTGESQRKDGLYAFKYKDALGGTRFVYSWRLVRTDRLPKGKRECVPLREKEDEIRRDLADGIDHVGKRMTVCQLYEKQNRMRPDVKDGTKMGRANLMRLLSEDRIGRSEIGGVRLSDAKEWVQRMQAKGYAYSTISNYKRSLKAAFFTAIQDDCVRRNPFDFKLSSVIRDDREPRVALSEEQEKALLGFLMDDEVCSEWLDAVVVLLGTGMRISELCGLTGGDVDFDGRRIRVDHQLVRLKGGVYRLDTTKTKSGVRVIYMTDEVSQALRRSAERSGCRRCMEVDGRRDFLFVGAKRRPMVAGDYTVAFRTIRNRYAVTGGVEMPKSVTAHTMRHTFCTRMAMGGMNPKALQYIMGHADIKMTLDYYAHADEDDAVSEMRRFIEKTTV